MVMAIEVAVAGGTVGDSGGNGSSPGVGGDPTASSITGTHL